MRGGNLSELPRAPLYEVPVRGAVLRAAGNGHGPEAALAGDAGRGRSEDDDGVARQKTSGGPIDGDGEDVMAAGGVDAGGERAATPLTWGA